LKQTNKLAVEMELCKKESNLRGFGENYREWSWSDVLNPTSATELG
jgi:hypothetical protein